MLTTQQKYDRISNEMGGIPPHIGHVIYWIENNCYEEKYIVALRLIWKDKRLPLYSTDEKLIDFIYSLID